MKIGLVCPYLLSRPGGVRTHIFALYDYFSRLKHEMVIISPQDKYRDRQRRIIYLGQAVTLPANASLADFSFYFLSMTKPIEQILKREKFDVIHFHEPLLPFLSLQILGASTARNVATFHGYPGESWLFEYIKPIFNLFKKQFLPRINRAICVSPLVKQFYEDYFPGEIKIIPNGVDIHLFNPKIKPLKRFKDGKINILCVGRLEERKGISYLLEALRKLTINKNSLRLILIGDGPLRTQIAAPMKDLSKEMEVVWEKRVHEQDLPQYYRSADIFVSPAIRGESFGIVLIEAMASGVAILAFANNAYQLVLKDVSRFSLAENRNSGVLAVKLERLIEDKNLRRALRLWGLQEVKKYSWQTVAPKILKLYQK